jgi:uncharacterized membrane protein YvlD (DUF360 family)
LIAGIEACNGETARTLGLERTVHSGSSPICAWNCGAGIWRGVIIGFVNGTIGLLLKILTFPLIVLTFGIFWFIINALMLKFASLLVPGFYVQGFAAAFWGAIILSLLNIAVRQVLR